MNTGIYRECSMCGNISAREVTRDLEIAVPEGKISITGDTITQCSNPECSAEYYTGIQSESHSSKVKKARAFLRKSETLLSNDEISEIRKKFSLSQNKFEHALGMGPKTLIRWEKGYQSPGISADNLLRLLNKYPFTLNYLAELRTGQPLWDKNIEMAAYIKSFMEYMIDRGINDPELIRVKPEFNTAMDCLASILKRTLDNATTRERSSQSTDTRNERKQAAFRNRFHL